MRKTILRAVVLLFVLAATGAALEIEYELKFGRPNTHLMGITMRASGLRGPAAEMLFPAGGESQGIAKADLRRLGQR
jgi:hypothetical protein